MAKIAFILLLAAFLPTVISSSRECYQCLSETSWEDCDSKRVKVRCLTSQQCVKATAESSFDKAYLRACAKTCDASDVPQCNESGVKCKVDCCSSDFCNAGPRLLVSSSVLMACVLLAMAHFC